MGNQEMHPLVQFAPSDQIADLYGRLLVHWEPPQHYVRQDLYDAALAHAAAAEARAVILKAAVQRADVALTAWLTGYYDEFLAREDSQVMRDALTTWPGPLLALARASVTAWWAGEWYPPDGDPARPICLSRDTWSILSGAVLTLPVWLRNYLTREAGDAESR